MSDYQDFKIAVEALSNGRNTVLLDDIGFPSVVMHIPSMISADLAAGLPRHIHPGFVAGTKTPIVYLSKYPNIVRNDRAYSLPLRHPEGNMSYDDAIKACRNKGLGWGLTPASLWSALALWCKKNNMAPRGNKFRGSARMYPEERGIVTGWEDGKPCETAVGSGPLSWYHDGTPSGLADIVGNVSEWNAGMRLCHGEIQIIPNADSILPSADLGEHSDAWRAILPDGTLCQPGSKDTLKIDMENGHWKISRTVLNPVDDARGSLFRDMTFDPVELPDGIPGILKELTIYPAEEDRSTYAEDLVFLNNFQAERICLRGGNWSSGPHSGIFYYAMDARRTRCLPRLDFRSAFYDLR
jgi:hypothetical protein